MMISTVDLVLWMLIAFFAGMLGGKLLEALMWRASAMDYRKRKSAGKVYVVRQEWA